VDLISCNHSFDYITDMLHLPELVAWQEKSGLTVTELAMIQPTYEFLKTNTIDEILSLLTELATPDKDHPNLEGKQKSISSNIYTKLRYLRASKSPHLTRTAMSRLYLELEEWNKTYLGRSDCADKFFLEVAKLVLAWMDDSSKVSIMDGW